jgi:arylsulfatase
MKTKLIVSALRLALICIVTASAIAQSPAPSSGKKPNILVIFGDDIGQTNVSAYSMA